MAIGSDDPLIGQRSHSQDFLHRSWLVRILDGPIAGLVLFGFAGLI